jgi:hypothetical protein
MTRGGKAIQWIEKYCVVPSGLERGQRVRLTKQQRDTIREIYDDSNAAPPVVARPLSAYLALLHVCGPEALQHDVEPPRAADVFSTWAAAGPDLKAVLRRDGSHIVCPELGTRYPMAAA